jgi:hypothetical protein
MEAKTARFDRLAITLIFIVFLILYIISHFLGMPTLGYFFVCLPFLCGLLITRMLYRNYSKFLKSSVDAILYFQTSLIAIVLVIKTVVKEVPDDLFTSHLHTMRGFLYVYFMAIAAVTKCCISYCDSKVYYQEEYKNLVAKAEAVSMQKKKIHKQRKTSLLIGTTIVTLLLLIFK